MNPLPDVEEKYSIKISFQDIGESFRIFALIEAAAPESLRELRDSSGRTFFIAAQEKGWISRVIVTVHRSQQPSGLRTALIQAHQSGEEILIRDYDTAQIYKGVLIAVDPKHRTRVKWADEFFVFEFAITAEGVFNLLNESQITWRENSSTMTPERGYPY